VKEGVSQGVFVVSIGWLYDSVWKWKRMEEKKYLLVDSSSSSSSSIQRSKEEEEEEEPVVVLPEYSEESSTKRKREDAVYKSEDMRESKREKIEIHAEAEESPQAHEGEEEAEEFIPNPGDDEIEEAEHADYAEEVSAGDTLFNGYKF
jgi:hypothetical protein